MPATLLSHPVSVHPLGAADIDGVDLAACDDAALAVIERAGARYLALRFRGQKLTDIDLMNLIRRIGKLDRVPHTSRTRYVLQ